MHSMRTTQSNPAATSGTPAAAAAAPATSAPEDANDNAADAPMQPQRSANPVPSSSDAAAPATAAAAPEAAAAAAPSSPSALSCPCNLVVFPDYPMAGKCTCARPKCARTGMRCISRGLAYRAQFQFDFEGKTYRVHRFINSGAHAHAFLAHEIIPAADGNGEEFGRSVCAKFFQKAEDKELRQLASIRSHRYVDQSRVSPHVVDIIGFSGLALRAGSGEGDDGRGAAAGDADSFGSAVPGELPGPHGFVLMDMGHLGEVLDYIYEGNSVAPFDERFNRRFFRQLLLGLQFMHEQGVWHRDLKPENLLFDAMGNLEICDFGLAKTVVPLNDRISMNPLQTSITGTRKQGSPSYMSPEMKSGNGVYNERTDVWSCGCTLLGE